MAIQNSIYLPNRITKKKYFYDPSLEKGILNVAYSLGRDSSLDNEHYKGVCFCPLNNKLYVIRRNSSSYVTKVDVICPASTTNAHEPCSTVNVDSSGTGSGAAIIYCPSVSRIFAVCEGKINIINPRTDQVENQIALESGDIHDATYFPNTNKIYVSHGSGGLAVVNPGKILNDGVLINSNADQYLNSILSPNLTQITKICGNPNKNYLYLFDKTAEHSAGVYSAYLSVSIDKENSESYIYNKLPQEWSDSSRKTRDVIYCPFDQAEYWLSSPDATYQESYVFRNGDDYFKTIKIKGSYNKLVYCPDNNMIYVLGDNTMQMINPADKKGITPVSQFFNENLGVLTNAVCYSPFMNRIYGVGNNGYIKYMDPTT